MVRKYLAACLVTTALTAPVLAQTTAPAPATAPAPTMAPAAQSSSASAGKFVTQQSANHWRASKLVGLVVYGTNNERIGDVNEILVDRNGNAEAVVVGVGGFLGLGEKDVAVPFKAVEWMMTSDANRTAANTNPGTGTTASTVPPATGTANTTGSTTGTTASTTGTAANRSPTASDMTRGYPDHAVLRMSKTDLEGAPTFRYAGSTATTDTGMRSDPGTMAPAGTAPGTTAPGTANPPNRP